MIFPFLLIKKGAEFRPFLITFNNDIGNLLLDNACLTYTTVFALNTEEINASAETS